MSSSTPAILAVRDFDELVEHSMLTVRDTSFPEQSSTSLGSRLVSRFSSALLPLATAAAFGAPVQIRRTFSASEISGSPIMQMAWALDVWTLTEEWADAAQVRMLNEMLALPAVAGFELDFSDDA